MSKESQLARQRSVADARLAAITAQLARWHVLSIITIITTTATIIIILVIILISYNFSTTSLMHILKKYADNF